MNNKFEFGFLSSPFLFFLRFLNGLKESLLVVVKYFVLKDELTGACLLSIRKNFLPNSS